MSLHAGNRSRLVFSYLLFDDRALLSGVLDVIVGRQLDTHYCPTSVYLLLCTCRDSSRRRVHSNTHRRVTVLFFDGDSSDR